MTDESTTDDLTTLATMGRDFRADDGVRAPSTEEVIAQAARDARKERLEWVWQIAGPTFAAIALVYTAVQMGSVMFTIFAAVAIPTLFGHLGFFIHVRHAATQSLGASIGQHVGAVVERRRADLRIARAARAVMAVLIVAFWIWCPVYVWSRSALFLAEPWRIVVSVCLAVVIFTLSWRRVCTQVTKAAAELHRWSAIAESLEPT